MAGTLLGRGVGVGAVELAREAGLGVVVGVARGVGVGEAGLGVVVGGAAVGAGPVVGEG